MFEVTRFGRATNDRYQPYPLCMAHIHRAVPAGSGNKHMSERAHEPPGILGKKRLNNPKAHFTTSCSQNMCLYLIPGYVSQIYALTTWT